MFVQYLTADGEATNLAGDRLTARQFLPLNNRVTQSR